MRRQSQEITDKNTLQEILNKEHVCRLGLCSNNTPYIVPVNFAVKENILYFHSAQAGMKIDMIKQNNNICFEVDTNVEFVQAEQACQNSMKYQSIIAFGKAQIIEDVEEKKKAFDLLLKKYTSKGLSEYPQINVEHVSIIKIHITSMTGKHSK